MRGRGKGGGEGSLGVWQSGRLKSGEGDLDEGFGLDKGHEDGSLKGVFGRKTSPAVCLSIF